MHDSLRALDAHRARLTALVEALPIDVVRARPGPRAWSLAQLLDHLVRIDRGFDLDGAAMGRLAAATSAPRARLICAVLALPIRIPAPPGAAAVMPADDPDPAETLAAWASLRSDWSARLPSASPTTAAFRHPIVGPLAPRDALAFLLAHACHHDAQVRRTLHALGRAETF